MYSRKRVVLLLVSFLMIGILSSCNRKPKKTDIPKEHNVLEVADTSMMVHYDYPATLNGQQVIDIRPKVDGYIEAICVEEGASVKKGQILFRINNPQYEENVRTAQASVKSAEADVYTAKMNINKVTPLVQKDIVSKYELESVQYTLQAKQAALSQAQASLAIAKTNLDYTIVRSPLDGVIGSIPYKVGSLVSSSSNEPLTVLSDINKVYAYFSLNEKQLLSILNDKPGTSLQDKMKQMPNVTLILSDKTEYSEKGKLEMASGLISTETGTASLKAIFANDKHILRSGSSAVVRLPQKIQSALLVPQSATLEVLDKRFVYVVRNDNKVYSTSIRSTASDDGQFLIVTDGLKQGDRIVLDGITALRDSMMIVQKPVSANSIFNQTELQKK